MKSASHKEKMQRRRESQRESLAYAGGFLVRDEGKPRFISLEERAVQIQGFVGGMKEIRRKNGCGSRSKREQAKPGVGGQTIDVLLNQKGE